MLILCGLEQDAPDRTIAGSFVVALLANGADRGLRAFEDAVTR